MLGTARYMPMTFDLDEGTDDPERGQPKVLERPLLCLSVLTCVSGYQTSAPESPCWTCSGKGTAAMESVPAGCSNTKLWLRDIGRTLRNKGLVSGWDAT